VTTTPDQPLTVEQAPSANRNHLSLREMAKFPEVHREALRRAGLGVTRKAGEYEGAGFQSRA
jgi:hypothetical protein